MSDDQQQSAADPNHEDPEDPEFPFGGFLARGVAVEESADLGTFSVSLAEGREGAGESITIAISLQNDQQDIQLGMDTYCVSNRWGATAYGGVNSYRIDDRRLVLYFSNGAARSLGVHRTFVIDLRVSDHDIEKVSSGLVRMLGRANRGRRGSREEQIATFAVVSIDG